MQRSEHPLIDEAALQQRVAELAQEVRRAYPDALPLCLCVLKGSVFFAADFVRHLGPEVELDFIRARSYLGLHSSGTVALTHTPEADLRGRHLLVLEDIVDTGRSARVILDWLDAQAPASVRLCTLLDKPSRRELDVTPDFVGFSIPDAFVVGYGLDHNERYRALRAIYILEPPAKIS
ncbi:MAG: hypoxanthine phosphoribosyltransferase [Candidatus Hydrogenedentes bacterium]|nr:hypoxanthine phosphoribosyltransferase [Candidatus Hydrogenedentota bacterium]